MYKFLSKYVFIQIAFIFFLLPTQAQVKIKKPINDTLIIGVAGSEPFVFEKKNKGIAVEIWEKISDMKSWNVKYVHFERTEEAIQELQKGDLDVLVGPISITSDRLENMRFSQPFYNSSISIMSRSNSLHLWQKIKPFFSIKLLMAIVLFLIILAIVGTFLWLAERKASPEQFPKEPLNGIGNGMWLAIVTMSTTGYGDKAPVTLMGRIIAGSWMVISIIFATSMVAGIASTLTLFSLGSKTISNIEQLAESNVATISDSPSVSFLHSTTSNVIGVNNLKEAIKKLENKEVEAIIYDRPQLLYYIKDNPDDKLYISKAEYYKQGYGFAFPINSPLILDVNRALLELSESQEIDKIVHKYIEKDE